MDRNDSSSSPPIALTIAGSDSGGGAGLQADLKTFAANRVFGTSVVTLVTAQNTLGVDKITVLERDTIEAQFRSVIIDLPPEAAKTGALGNEATISLLAELLQEHPIQALVVDPVMVSKHGRPLLAVAAVKAYKTKLFPKSLLVTPNRYEAELITGRSVGDIASMREAAKAIHDMGSQYVLLKGSHLGKVVKDLFYDGSGFIEFGADRVDSKRVHGSGCTFSACITARLAHQEAIEDAVDFARRFITQAIEAAPEIGNGISPVNPMHPYW